MKKNLLSFFNRDAMLLYISILGISVFPVMISACVALVKGELLGETEIFFTKMFGILIGIIILCFAFGTALNNEYTYKKALYQLPKQLLNGVLPILAVYVVIECFFTVPREQMSLPIYLFMSLIETLLFVPAICRLALSSKLKKGDLYLKDSSVLFLLHNLRFCILVMLGYSISKQIGTILSILFFNMEVFTPLSRQFIINVFITFLQWIVLVPIFQIAMKKILDPTNFPKKKEKVTKVKQFYTKFIQKIKIPLSKNLKNKITTPGFLVDGFFFIVFIIFTTVSIYNIHVNPKNIDGPNRGYLAISSIDDCIAIGDAAFAKNDYITAAIYYDYAKTLVSAWQGYLYDAKLLEETLSTNSTDGEIVLLSTLATDNSEKYIKYLINEGIDADYLLEALLSFDNVEGKRKILHNLISRGIIQK